MIYRLLIKLVAMSPLNSNLGICWLFNFYMQEDVPDV